MKQKVFWENFILVAIVLVIIQTFLHEVAIYSHWSIKARNGLLIAGFIFDFIFTTEFLVRTIIATVKRGDVIRYWLYERGWVDFLSSVPLLLLDSGPGMFFLISGSMNEDTSSIEVLNVLKVVKAVRVTRILRLVRIIKIFGKIQNTDSKMTQHHTSMVSTTAVFTIVCTLILFSFVANGTGKHEIKSIEESYRNGLIAINNSSKTKSRVKKLASSIYGSDKRILLLDYGKGNIISNVSDAYLKDYYIPGEDYKKVKAGRFTAYVSMVSVYKKIALNHIQSFFIIVFVVLAFMFLYTRHFAQNVSDLIHVLNKGLRKKDYNLLIKKHKYYSDHEIYKVVQFYNEAYLPSKLRQIEKKEKDKSSNLSISDLSGFNQ